MWSRHYGKVYRVAIGARSAAEGTIALIVSEAILDANDDPANM